MLTFDNLRREQRRVHEFIQLSVPFRDIVSEVPSQALKQATGGMTETLSFFIESELYYRQAERYNILKLHQQRAKSFEVMGRECNERGVNPLEKKVLSSFEQLRSDVSTLDHTRFAHELEEYQSDLRTFFAESEMKAKDVQRLDDAFIRCLDALQQQGVNGLVNHVEEGAKQLKKMREQSDRGVVENFPAWKLGGVIFLLGVGIIAFIHCNAFKCTVDNRNAYIVGLISVALVTLGC